MTKYSNYMSSLETMSGPYSRQEIPKIKINYRKLIAYAKSKNKTVPELSDKEKNMFIINGDMELVREKMVRC